jgi:uncharacterized protein (TIGR02679 family)
MCSGMVRVRRSRDYRRRGISVSSRSLAQPSACFIYPVGTVELASKLSAELAPVWRAVHARLSSGQVVTRVRVGPLSVGQQGALADLLGLARLPGEYAKVPLAQLDLVLLDAVGVDAREVVAELVGPVGDHAADRRKATAERSELWEWLAGHRVVEAQPALAGWVDTVRRGGLVAGSVQRTRNELGRVLLVLAQLPVPGVPLPVFAESVLGDTHALDEGGRCANLVLRALATLYDVPVPMSAQERRALWERVGIAEDELSSTVLAAGFPAAGDDVVGRVLRVCAEAGQAAVLTLQQLRAHTDMSWAPGDIWVFENPSVVALALARFGDRCPPMVCVSGWPSGAGILFLRNLAAGGARLHYHGDFDGEGLRIAANVIARTGATPWRMSSADYLGAVGGGPSVGRVTDVPWDTELAGHLLRLGTTVAEERVASNLLDELWELHTSR